MSFGYSPDFTRDRYEELEAQRTRQQERRRSAENASTLVCVATTLVVLIAAVASTPRAAQLIGYAVEPWLVPALAAIGFVATLAFAFIGWRQRQ